MHILVTLDSNYIKPLKVMLKSLFINNSGEMFNIHLIHSSIEESELADLKCYIESHGGVLHIYLINDHVFEDAPKHLYYTKEMYYRLLAFKLLPTYLERILYLDPDILVINNISPLYHMDLEDNLYAAAYHDIVGVKEINQVRFYPYQIDAYYNTGVLLMNLNRLRETVDEQSIYEFVAFNHDFLTLPDQDVFNALYAKQIMSLDEKYFNYDVRYFSYYKMTSQGKWDMDQVMRHSVILHFCGKLKPWKKGYSGKFHALYKHYEKLA